MELREEANFKVEQSRRKFLGTCLIIPGILMILYFFFGLSSGWGLDFGLLFISLAGITFVIAGIIRIKVKGAIFRGKAVYMKRILVVFLALWLLSFIVIEALIIYSSIAEDNIKVDYVIVMGARVRGDVISLTLKNRLDAAYKYAQDYPGVKLVVSGAQGSGENLTEAEAMRRYLVGKGMEEDQIIKEEKATSSLENIIFSRDIIEKIDHRDQYKIMIVTNDFHIYRSKLLAKRQELDAYGLPAKTPLVTLPACYVREYFAMVKSLIFD